MAFNDFENPYSYDNSQQNMQAVNQGLRSYMLGVYAQMGVALTITALTAYLVVNSALQAVFFHINAAGALAPSLLGWVAVLSPLAFMLVLQFGINRLSVPTARLLLLAFSLAMGVSCATILFSYTGASVVRTFFIAASLFFALSIWGYTTGKSLVGMGAFLFMATIGLMIAMLVNVFFPSSMLTMIISFVGVLVFAGLTAVDTQRIKSSYMQYLAYMPQDAVAKQSVCDALAMYLDFLNLFQFLLQLTGNSRSND